MTTQISPLRRRCGFTLLELLMVIAIIGILASIAYPTYKKYVNEARAAELLVHVHEISLAYHDVFATAPGSVSHDTLSSPEFGQPPPYLPGLQHAYARTNHISASSQLVNHAGFFQHTGHGEFPVLFLRAENPEGEAILRALDHVTGFEHTFVTPSVLMIALARPHEIHQAGLMPAGPTETTSGITPASGGSRNPTETGNPTGSTSSNSAGTQTSSTQIGQPAQTTEPPAQTTQRAPVVQEPQNQLNWPPGWVKHPQQHENQQHGHGN